MNEQELKKALAAGKRVFWMNNGYEVIHNHLHDVFVKCHFNGNLMPLSNHHGELDLSGFENGLYVDRDIDEETKWKIDV
jgi:hypothetical protein